MKNSLQYLRLIVMVAGAAFFAACQEKIELDLNSAQSQLVIEGLVTDQPGVYGVAVSKSKIYDEDNTPVFVIDATVVISDDAGNTDTLTQASPGIYVSGPKQGVPGRTYTLNVFHENVLYQAKSTMQAPVAIDSIYYMELAGFSNPEEMSKRPYCIINDPQGLVNYYVLKTTINGKLDGGTRVYSDRLWDGKPRNIRAPGNNMQTGDSVLVQLFSVDKQVFDYFFQLDQNSGNFGQPAAPANPTSNISPNALGYFSAHSVTTKLDIVK